MSNRLVFGMAAVALAVFVTIPSASAACSTIRTAKTYNSGTGNFNYWHAPSGDATGSLIGATWQLGNPAVWSTGNCNTVNVGNPTPGFLYFGPGGIGLNMELAACGNGCPVSGSTLAVLAQKKDPSGVTDFLVATVVETPAGAVNFDYSTQGAHQMIRLPRPRVLSSSRAGAGSDITLHLAIDSIAAGLFGPNAASAVTGFNLLVASSAWDPGRDSSSFALSSTAPSPGGAAVADATVTINCTNPAQDIWIVTQLVFEGGAVTSQATSDPTRIHCNPAVADPKYKVVPKRVGPPKAIQH